MIHLDPKTLDLISSVNKIILSTDSWDDWRRNKDNKLPHALTKGRWKFFGPELRNSVQFDLFKWRSCRVLGWVIAVLQLFKCVKKLTSYQKKLIVQQQHRVSWVKEDLFNIPVTFGVRAIRIILENWTNYMGVTIILLVCSVFLFSGIDHFSRSNETFQNFCWHIYVYIQARRDFSKVKVK